MSDRTVKLTRKQASELKAVLLEALDTATDPAEISGLLVDLAQLADVNPTKFATAGVLRPEDQTEPVMTCARCGSPVTLVWLHPTTNTEKIPRPSVWSRDVAVVCPKCSGGKP